MAPLPRKLALLLAMSAAGKPVYSGTEHWDVDKRRARNRTARAARRVNRRSRA